MNIYLIVSDSFKKINAEVEKIIPVDFPVYKYDLRESTMRDVINEANYFSLTGEKKYILVKCGDLFKTSRSKKQKEVNIEPDDTEGELEEIQDNKDLELLENYLNNPSENSILILTTQIYPDKRKKIYKTINKIGKVIEFPTLNKKELVYNCMDILKEHKYKIDYSVANYIVENSFTNYDIMLNEIDKIFVLVKPCTLTEKSLEDVIAKGVTNNTYNYINSLIDGDIRLANKYSEDFNTLKIDPVVILILLYKEIQIYYLLKSGVSYNEVKKTFNKEDWQMQNYLAKKDNFTLNELKKIIIKLNDYDYNYKSGLIDKSVIIDLLTLDFCE